MDFFFMAGRIEKTFGIDRQKTLGAAWVRLARQVQSENCNSFELQHVTRADIFWACLALPWRPMRDVFRKFSDGRVYSLDKPASAVPDSRNENRLYPAERLDNIMNIRPLYDRIVVKRIDEKENLRNGIIIPDSARGEAAGRRSPCRPWQEA